ncbi:hypothetical protein ACYZTM_29190 [Pseudomonas sp. MDT2-39-1]
MARQGSKYTYFSVPSTFDPPKVIGVADSEDDPEGYIPFELLAEGIDVVVPLWQDPVTIPGEVDTLRVFFDQPGHPLVKVEKFYGPEDIRPEFIVHIGPEHLRTNGPGNLWYEQTNPVGNPARSFQRTLTVDHTPVNKDLPVATFPHANAYSYLNCSTQPPIWEGVTVKIPPLTGFKAGDRCVVTWRAYATLNGSGIQFRRAFKQITRANLSEQDIREGFLEVVAPYDIHIKPMVINASALVNYRVYRGTRLLGQSKTGLVRVDRIISGEEVPCGP